MAEEQSQPQPPSTTNPHSDLITSFTEITSSSIEEATFFLESHGFDLDSAISTFFETTANPNPNPNPNDAVNSPASSSPSRSRSVSPPPSFDTAAGGGGVGTGTGTGTGGVYNLRSRNTGAGAGSGSGRNTGTGRIRTFADLNKKGCEDCDSGSDEDDGDKPQEYYTGGQRSGQVVQDPSKRNDVESLFEQARQAAGEDGIVDQHQPSSSSRSFSGRGRLLSGETPSAAPAAPQQQPETHTITHTVTFWNNGFTVDDGPLRGLDDPQNASFLESIRRSECPQELTPAKGRAPVTCSLVRKLEDYPIKKEQHAAFTGMGRTLGSSSANDTTATIPAPTFAPPTPYVGLVVDDTLPSTSIQLRLGDGTRMVSRFNLHHTVGNIRSFIDASRAGGPRAYQLLTMGFPPKQLNDLNQTIQDAGLANSVVIQKL